MNQQNTSRDVEHQLKQARRNLIQSVGRITDFWGYNKAMGELYALLYLSPEPMSLDEMAEEIGLSKASVSIHMRALERIRMVNKVWMMGDRKDYYEAEVDFWEIAKGIFREREAREFRQALDSVTQSLELVQDAGTEDNERVQFYLNRLKHMQDFFKTLDTLISAVLTLDELRLGALARLGQWSRDE